MSRRKMLFRGFVLFCVGLVLAGCATEPTLRELLDELPVKQLSFYDFDPSTPLVDRITDAPEELLALYSSEENTYLSPYRPTPDERVQLGEVFDRLPVRHREILERRLIGVYCVDDFAGSGMADYILGPNDDLYATLVLHPRVFTMSAAEILAFRANTAFSHDDPAVELVVDLSEEVSGLAYIVLHESTHIVDYVERHTPYVEPGMNELFGRSTRDTSFTDQLWSGYRTLGPSVDFVYQTDLRFYGLGGEPPLTNGEIAAVYEALSRTPFASLYASVSWAEDFAEYVTFHYLVHGLGARYVIRVVRDGESVFTYEPMESPAVVNRAGLIDPELLEPSENE